MQLDYNAASGAFIVRIPRSENVMVQSLMREHGFDFSLPASTPKEAVLFTKEPYAAASFASCASPSAITQLRPLLSQIELSWKKESNANISCPADKELWPFQKCDIEYALTRKCTLIGDQPGLGKTPVAICFANEIRAKRVLVICPASIRIQWVKKIREWTVLRWPYCIHPILVGRHGVHPNAEWTVVSYDLARTEAIGKALAKGHYDLLVLDEAHYLKTSDSRRTRAVFGGGHERVFEDFASRSERILALTGTPLPNRPREAYTLARGLCLAAGTHVLTNEGSIAIEGVTKQHLLWDGNSWVSHAGLSYQGEKETLNVAGVWATPEHKVFHGLKSMTTWLKFSSPGNIHSRVLEKGLASLLSWGIQLVQAEQPSLYAVIVEKSRTASPLTTLEKSEAVGLVHLRGLFKNCRTNEDTQKLYLTLLCVIGYLIAYRVPSDGATTLMMQDTNITALEAYLSISHGEITESLSWPISQNFRVLMTHLSNWIGATTRKGTCLEIFASSRLRLTPQISGQSADYKNESTSLRHCYDLVNAGPLRRFTILTDEGALLVSNCWDSIDWMSEAGFQERFNPSMTMEKIDPHTGRTKIYVDERSGRHSELQNRLRANFMTRHLKREVMGQLKMPVFDIIQLEETTAVKQALKAESLLQIDPENLEGANFAALGAIATVRRMMGLALAPQIADYVDMLIDGGEEKLVVFAYHHEVLDILQKAWERHGVLRVDGGTSATKKMRSVELFQADPAKQIFLGQIQACGTGTDGLQTVSCHALIAEPDWVPGTNEQAFDRLDRGGQNRVVQGDIFVAPNSFAEKILASALRKGHVVHASLDKQFI